MSAHVLGEESQHEIAVLLEQDVFAPVAAIGVGVGQVLRTVQFDHDSQIPTEQIHFHSPAPIEGDGQLDIQVEPSVRFGQ